MVDTGKDYLFIDAGGDISADRIAPGPTNDVASTLRAAREARGLDLPLVAQELRIREAYLKSLESGSYDGLPAIPYAAGFVRSYAEYLDLDAADLVRRFKAEVSAAADVQPLAFPQPVRYGGLPGVTLVAGSLIVAALLFGGWYMFGPQGDGASGSDDTATVATAPAPKTAGDRAADAAGKIAADAAVKAGTKTKDAPAGSDGAGTRTTADAKGAGKDDAAGGTQSGGTQPGGTRSGDAPAKDPSIGQSATTSGAMKNADGAVPEAKKPTTQQAALPKDDTIVLRATANAWVQIKDANNRVVFVKVLRAGETYKVPKQDGLIMNVGNAGGLQISVGDRKIKPLGPSNIPVFNIALDPRALLEQHR